MPFHKELPEGCKQTNHQGICTDGIWLYEYDWEKERWVLASIDTVERYKGTIKLRLSA